MKLLKVILVGLLSISALCCSGLYGCAENSTVNEINPTIPSLECEIVTVSADEDFETDFMVDTADKQSEKETNPNLVMRVRCTAYCSCGKCCGKYAKNRPLDENGKEIVLTASGARAIQGVTISVDKNIIPLGSTVIINGNEYIAQDTGNPNVVKDNVIDIYFDNHEAALAFGVQYAEAKIYFPQSK